MAILKSVLVGFLACFIVGAVAGAAGGWYVGVSFLLDNWVTEQSNDVKGHIEVLKILRAGNTGQAIEVLEMRLDDDLVVLEPEGYRIGPDTRKNMYATLRAAQQYRTEQPRTSKRRQVDEMVANVLKKQYP